MSIVSMLAQHADMAVQNLHVAGSMVSDAALHGKLAVGHGASDLVVLAQAEGGISVEEFRQKLLETTSLRSTVTQQDIANMALFLCTKPGERITGQAIPVDADVRYLV